MLGALIHNCCLIRVMGSGFNNDSTVATQLLFLDYLPPFQHHKGYYRFGPTMIFMRLYYTQLHATSPILSHSCEMSHKIG